MNLISVIVPIYNVEKYIRKCIDSIINQTYINLEIILVDDGSPDNCGEICDEYAKKDNRIKVIHKQNGGLSSSRNAGLDIAKGEYISFIDSDDYVAENFIEKLYDVCIKNEADIAECDFLKFENDVLNENNQEYSCECYKPIEMQNKIFTKENVKTIVVWNKLYKKYIYENLRFPEGKINEDEFITYKAFYNCKRNIAVINEKLYYYRFNSESIMGSKFNVKRLDALEALKERKTFYKEKNEEELYEKSVAYYQNALKKYYILVRENIENPKNYFTKIKKESKKNLKDYMKLKNVNTIEKIKMRLFFCVPNIYCEYIKMRNGNGGNK